MPGPTQAELEQKAAQERLMSQRLFAERAFRNSRMPDVYKTDEWVASQLEQKVDQPNEGVAVYWTTGMRAGSTAVSAYDAVFIQAMLDDPHNAVTRVIIPENNGGHWTFAVLQKDAESGKVTSHHVSTRADGTCGDSLVEEAEKVAKLTDAAFKAEIKVRQKQASSVGRATSQAPTVVSGVTLAVDVVETKKELRAAPVTDVVSEATFSSVVTPQLIAEAQESATLDYNLVQLASADLDGDAVKVQYYQSKLVDLYTQMGTTEKAEALVRLMDSGLADKPSLIPVIEAATEQSAALTP